MNKTPKAYDASRRTILKKGMIAAAGVLTASSLFRIQPAQAGNTPKAAMMYQDKPHGKQKCAGCIHFIPDKNPKANGTCNVVAGSISPLGWCVAFAPKS